MHSTAIVGNGNVSAAPLVDGTLAITFQGAYAGESIPDLVADPSGLTGGVAPSVFIVTATAGTLSPTQP